MDDINEKDFEYKVRRVMEGLANINLTIWHELQEARGQEITFEEYLASFMRDATMKSLEGYISGYFEGNEEALKEIRRRNLQLIKPDKK